MQSLSPRLQFRCRLRPGAALPERAEIVIGRDFVNELACHEFDHDRVIEVAEAWDLVGNQIVRIDEVREGIEDARAIGPFEAPLEVGQHGDQLLEDPDPLAHEVGRPGLQRLLGKFCGAVDHDRLVLRALARPHLPEALAEEAQIFITEFEDVHEAAVFGMPHERLGEEAACAVLPKKGRSIDIEILRVHLSAKLASFKVPSIIEVVTEALPRNAAGKILKRDIRDALVERDG